MLLVCPACTLSLACLRLRGMAVALAAPVLPWDAARLPKVFLLVLSLVLAAAWAVRSWRTIRLPRCRNLHAPLYPASHSRRRLELSGPLLVFNKLLQAVQAVQAQVRQEATQARAASELLPPTAQLAWRPKHWTLLQAVCCWSIAAHRSVADKALHCCRWMT